MMHDPRHAGRLAAKSGFSMLESVLSLFIVGALLATSMNAVTAALRLQSASHHRARAHLLAQGLMAEILDQAYAETFESPTFGPEPSEINGTRAAFDDVDDYHQWNVAPPYAPPQATDGTPLPGCRNWVRKVTVSYVDPNNLALAVASDQGVKRVTVTVYLEDRLLASLVMIKTDAWVNIPIE